MRINVVAFSTNGCRTALRVKDALEGEDVRLFSKTSSDSLGLEAIEGKTSEWTGRSFEECDAIVFVGAIGIAVRYIAPYVKRKDRDPAIVCLDELGRWTVALLSGHIGGCNALTERIATAIGSEPIITTATDLNGRFSVDTFATLNGLRIMSLAKAKDASARILDGRFIGLHSEIEIIGKVPDGLTVCDSGEFGICISPDPGSKPFGSTLNLVPMDIVLGVGCKRGTDPDKLKEFVRRKLSEMGIAPERVGAVASIDLKKDEAAILDLASSLRAPVTFHTSDELNSLEGEFSSSGFVRSVTAVDCVCERSAALVSGGRDFLLRKTAENGMTLAVCRRTVSPRFD